MASRIGGLLSSTTNRAATTTPAGQQIDYTAQINQLYKNTLGRDIEQAGANYYQQQLAGGRSLASIGDEIANSDEAKILSKSGTAAARNLTSPASAVGYNTTDVKVDPQSTVQGQLASITGTGSALNKQAETSALKSMTSRGLLNSSIAVGAGQDAVLRNALPIAQQDASTNFNAASTNAQQKTAASQFLAGAQNATSQFNAGQTNAMQQTLTQADVQKKLAEIQANTSLTVAEKQIQSQQLIAQNDNAVKLQLQDLQSNTQKQLAEIQGNTSLSVADKQIASAQLIAQSEQRSREFINWSQNVAQGDIANKQIASQQNTVDKQLASQQAIADRDNQTKLQLQQIDGDIKKSLSVMDTDSKAKLAQVDADNKQLLQTNISAANAYAQLAQQLASISTSTTMDAAAKQQATDNQLNTFRATLSAIGKVSGLDLSQYYQSMSTSAQGNKSTAPAPAPASVRDTSRDYTPPGGQTEWG